MIRFALLSLLLALPLSLAAQAPKSHQNPPTRDTPPFAPGEMLKYDLDWSGFHVGTVTFRCKEKDNIDGQEAWCFTMEARTNGFADKFYKVRDIFTSYVAGDFSRSLRYYTDQDEGGDQRDVQVHFQWHEQQATYKDSKKPRQPAPMALDEPVFDPLSFFYAVRNLQITRPGLVVLPLSDGQKTIHSRIRVIGRETIRVNGRDRDCWLVEPALDGVGGVFKKSKGASLQIWFSNDGRFVPLKITSKVRVGAFSARLRTDRPGQG